MSTVLVVLTGVSLAIALFSSVVAWRVVREERRRSEARVRGLAAAISGHDAGRVEPESAPTGRVPIATTVACAAVAALLVLAVSVFSVDGAPGTRMTSPAPMAETRQAEPFELVALTHDRTRTLLTVRGIVRNPLRGTARGDIAAVVHLYDERGELVASGRAPVTSALSPGDESTFVVAVPDRARVERYRVSFSGAAGIVPHVDRREGV